MLLSFSLYGPVDIVNKGEGAEEADKAKHQEECVCRDARITKIKGELEGSTHVAAVHVVVKAVGENKGAGGPAIQYRRPPPAMILPCKLKVKQCHRDKRSHND